MSYVDVKVLQKFWAFAQKYQADDENGFYAVVQGFLFNVCIKIAFSGEILINSDDCREVKEYFTEFRSSELVKLL